MSLVELVAGPCGHRCSGTPLGFFISLRGRGEQRPIAPNGITDLKKKAGTPPTGPPARAAGTPGCDRTTAGRVDCGCAGCETTWDDLSLPYTTLPYLVTKEGGSLSLVFFEGTTLVPFLSTPDRGNN